MMITVRGFSALWSLTDSLITVHPHCDHCTDSLITVHPHCDHCTDSLITVTATPFMIIVITTLLRLPWSLLSCDYRDHSSLAITVITPLSQWYGILPHDTYVINASGKQGWLSPLLPRMQLSSQRMSTLAALESWRTSTIAALESWRTSILAVLESWRTSILAVLESWRTSTLAALESFRERAP